jgi:dihydrofolate synthase/folylpolyglutamate synthase
MEVVRRSPLVVIDGAHNPDGVAALAAALDEEFLPTEWIVVFGARGSRDPVTLLEPLDGSVAKLYAAEAADPEAIPAGHIAAAARKAFGPSVPVTAAGPVPEAVAAALADAGEDGAVLVTGSLYVVGEARRLLRVDRT